MGISWHENYFLSGLFIFIPALILLIGYLLWKYRGEKTRKNVYLVTSVVIAGCAMLAISILTGKFRVRHLSVKEDNTYTDTVYSYYNFLTGNYPSEWGGQSLLTNGTKESWILFHLGNPNENDGYVVTISPGESIIFDGNVFKIYFEPKYYDEDVTFFLGEPSYLMPKSVYEKLRIGGQEKHTKSRGSNFYTYPFSFEP